ncbi:MerR, DNA binding [compost metagenome]
MIACLKKTGMPLEEMRPFLAVSTDTDPAEYPELVELLKSHRKHIVNQIASLQQIVDFIDMKLGEGRFRRDCSDEIQGEKKGEPKPKPVSPAEMSFFSGSTIRH